MRKLTEMSFTTSSVRLPLPDANLRSNISRPLSKLLQAVNQALKTTYDKS